MRFVVNVANGAVAQQIDYDVFGNATLVAGSWDFQPFGFAGGLYDPVTRLVRFGARDYDPQVGRWVSKDPIRFLGSDTNLYVYASNDPVNLVDPSGQITPGVVIGAMLGFLSGITSSVDECGEFLPWQQLLFDPTGASVAFSFGVGLAGNTAGQLASMAYGAYAGDQVGNFNVGSALGSGLGTALGIGVPGAAARQLSAGFGASPALADLLAGLAAFPPATGGSMLGGAVDNATRAALGGGGGALPCRCRS